jgi:hypothetical protein
MDDKELREQLRKLIAQWRAEATIDSRQQPAFLRCAIELEEVLSGIRQTT